MHGPVSYASLLSTTTKRTSLALSTYSMLWMALHRSFAQNVPATTFEEARCCSSTAVPILSCPNKLPLHPSAGCPGWRRPSHGYIQRVCASGTFVSLFVAPLKISLFSEKRPQARRALKG